MFGKALVVVGMIAFWGCIPSAQAESDSVTLRVDGLACPFCAYGLEKKLKKMEGINKFDILINEGKVKVEWDEENPFAFESVRDVVDKAGYTLRSAKAEFSGTVTKEDDRFLFVSDQTAVSGGEIERFSLFDPALIQPKSKSAHEDEGTAGGLGKDRVEQLEEIVKRNDTVHVFGTVHAHKRKDDLPALGIEQLEVVPRAPEE